MQKKPVLFYVVTKLELGGAQKQLLSLINCLDKERYSVYLFTAKEGVLLSEAYSISGLVIKKSRFLDRPINPLKDLLALIEIYFFIKKNKPDIIHTHSSKAGILGRCAARLANVKTIIHTVHGWSFNDYQPVILRRIFVWLERSVAKLTDNLIVVSNYDKQKGLANHIGNEKKYTIIRHGIDYSEFNIKDYNKRRELGIGDKDLVIIMTACFKPQKAPCDFIKLASLANKALPNIKFILVGDGILRKNIQSLINKLGLQSQVILTGWHRDVPGILSMADIFVLTSLWEGLPVALVEAMASSKPVIVTDTGGVRDVVVEGETGYLVQPGDLGKMSHRLVDLLKDSELRLEIGRKAKDNLGHNFTIQNMLKNTQDLYGKAIYAN